MRLSAQLELGNKIANMSMQWILPRFISTSFIILVDAKPLIATLAGNNIMKRYRVFQFDFDSHPKLLTMIINNDADETVKKLHIENTTKIYTQFFGQFGLFNSEFKINNFIEIGPKPFSVVAFHNKFQEQMRNSFIIGAYYPSLTAACALGERILNHLIIKLRDEFKNTPQYKKVSRKDSFDNWDLAIDTLRSWSVLLPKTGEYYIELKGLRNKAIHFNPEIDDNDHELALSAIKILTNIINEQFPGGGNKPWFIPKMRGESYIKKEYENDPFIKNIYLPNCYLVGPYHTIKNVNNKLILNDDNSYSNNEITDEEFLELRYNKKQADNPRLE